MNPIFLFLGALLVAFPRLLGWLVVLWLVRLVWSAAWR
jgi:hypothetical protein